jgi:hypothetical protein
VKSPRSRMVRWLLVVAAALLPTGEAGAQTTVDALVAAAQNPAPVNTLDVDGGYRFGYGSEGGSESWYRISYRGAMVRSAGTPFKYASGLDLATPAPTVATGDRNRIALRLEGGTTTVGGGLFEANGLQPLVLRGLGALDMRGSALVAGDIDGQKIQLAAGLESAPLRIPGMGRTGASNWVVLGIDGQRQEATDSAGNDETLGLLTYRAFLGRAFGWRKSADPGATAGRIAEKLLQQAPTYAAARSLAAEIRTVQASRRTSLQQLFLDAVTEAGSEEEWPRTVRELAFGNTDAVTDQATVAVYVEDAGWHSFAGGPWGSPLKNLLTATVDYWFLPARDDVLLRLRYENGFERATPSLLKNHLLVSIALRI